MQQSLAQLLPRGGTVSVPARIGKDTSNRYYCSFAGDSSQDITWTIPVVPEYFQGTGTLSLRGAFYTSTTSGNVRLSVAIEALTDGTNTGTSTFGSENFLTVSVPSTGGLLREFDIEITDADSLQPEQMARVRLTRHGADALDTCSAVIYLLGCELNENVTSITVNELVLGTPLAVEFGGTGAGDAYSALNNLLPDQTDLDGYVLQSQTGYADWVELGDLAYQDTVSVSQGGTGLSSIVANRVLYGAQFGAIAEQSADLTFNALNKNLALAGYHTIANQSASTIPLRIAGAASQSALLTDWRNSSNTSLASVSHLGGITGASLTSNSTIAGVSQTITNTTAATVPLSVKHASTPSVDFFNVLDSANAKVFAVSSDKSLLIPAGATSSALCQLTCKTDGSTFGTTEFQIQRNRTTNQGFGCQLRFTDNTASAYIKFVSNNVYQNGNDLEFWSSSGLCMRMGGAGTHIFQPLQNTNAPNLLVAPAQTIYPGGGTPSPQGLFVFEQCTYAATSPTTIADTAALLVRGAILQGGNMTNPNRFGALFLTGHATAKGFAVRGFTSQTGNLAEYQDVSGNILSRITANGAMQPASLADADAANGTLYYSTTSSKLTFKDSGGTTHDLY